MTRIWAYRSGFTWYVNTFEGYCEMRRLGYPTFGEAQGVEIYDASADNLAMSLLEPGELYTDQRRAHSWRQQPAAALDVCRCIEKHQQQCAYIQRSHSAYLLG